MSDCNKLNHHYVDDPSHPCGGYWAPNKGTANGEALVNASPKIVAITKSDVTVYDPPLLGIRVGTAGDVYVVSDGATVPLRNVAVSEHVSGEITQVLATGTTATNITGWRR